MYFNYKSNNTFLSFCGSHQSFRENYSKFCQFLLYPHIKGRSLNFPKDEDFQIFGVAQSSSPKAKITH